MRHPAAPRVFLRIAPRIILSTLLAFSSLLASLAAHSADAATRLRIAVVARDNGGKPTFIGSPQIVANDPVFLAALKQKNVQLEWVPVTTASVATLVNESFTNKSIDFAFYGDLPSVILNANGVSTKLVVPGGLGNNTYLVVPPGSSAKSIADLKGKKIALHRGRPWEVSFGKLIASQGLTLKDFRIINLNPQAGSAAVAAGNVDGFFTLNDALVLEDKKLARIIWSSQQAPADWKMRAELWGSADFVKQHADITQLLVTASVRASHWISQEKNRDGYIKDQALFGLPEAAIRRDYDGNKAGWKDYWAPLFTPTLSQHYQGVIDHAAANGLIRKKPDVKTLLAPQFLPVALKELKLESYWKPGT
ncbi:MAG: ABC transporter substrate-binding protein [Pedobacter sp.]|nr:ABC transporter substrate-binding protein [Pedobacter sp.]